MNWWEAYAFCIWDGGFLPSEAEYEYAAAGGSQEREYPWGSTAPGSGNQYAIYGCFYPDGSGCAGRVEHRARRNGDSGDGGGGQLDLEGNMSQWNLDWYRANYGQPCADCASLTGLDARVFRGASFVDFPSLGLLVTYRDSAPPKLRGYSVGFRCARSP